MNTKQLRAELLPCPFCGHDSIRHHRFGGFKGVPCCLECGVAVVGGDWNRRAVLQSQDRDREDANEWLEEMDDLLLEHIGGYDERKLVMNHARRVIPILGTTGDLLKALIEAEEMLCKQEDALRSLGAHEPNSEPAILGARAVIDHAMSIAGGKDAISMD